MSSLPLSSDASRTPEGDRELAVVRDMLRYAPCPEIGRATRAENLDSWDLPRAAGDFLLSDPNAFLLGCLFNYQVPYAKALSAPLELRRRLGHLEAARLAAMDWRDLAPSIARGAHGRSLHRFPNNLAKRVVRSSKRLVTHYGGLASNLWPDDTRVKVVLQRLHDFHGISQKISNMMVNMLVTSFGVRLSHWEEIDVAVDRHVARVFLRTGLVPKADGTYAVGDVAWETIHAARSLMPAFPGYLDGPAFAIGLTWCRADRADCEGNEETGPCPLRDTCRRRTGVHIHERPGARVSLCCNT
jgi:endonuclease-3